MARALLVINGAYREVFVVDAPVGTGCPNRRDDVLLVQYLLRVASENAGGTAGYLPPGEQSIAIDGVYGKQTQTYIGYFQKEVNRRQNRKLIEADGRVDAVRSGSSTSNISHTFYTVLALNAAMRARRGDAYRIETDALFPIDLTNSLFVRW